MHQLLCALASFGVVAETRAGCFVLMPFGQPQRKDHSSSEWVSVVFCSLADNWAYPAECIRTGDAPQARPEGVPSRWSRTPDAPAIFRAVFGAQSSENYLPIARAWDFSRYRTAADPGRGGGGLIVALLTIYPDLRGMLVDRPESIDGAASHFEPDGLGGRCRLLAADLREAVPAGADFYVLKPLSARIEDAAIQILRSSRSFLRKEAACW